MPCGGADPHVEITQRLQREWHALGEATPSSQNKNLLLTLKSSDSLRLPHALAYNSSAASEAMAGIAAAIAASDAPIGLYRLAVRLGVPTALRDLGVKESDLDRAWEIALSNPYWNPRPIEAAPCAICYSAPGRERNPSPEGRGVARHGSSPGEENGYERALHRLRCDHWFAAAKDQQPGCADHGS